MLLSGIIPPGTGNSNDMVNGVESYSNNIGGKVTEKCASMILNRRWV